MQNKQKSEAIDFDHYHIEGTYNRDTDHKFDFRK